MRVFLKDIRGNMAAVFAVTLLVIMLGIGAAVDFGSIASKKNTYQGLADAAVLAAARSGETEKDKLKKITKDFVNANNSTNDKLKTKISLDASGRISVMINGSYKPVIMSLFGKSKFEVNVASEAPLVSSEPVDVVLVLDATWSMNGAKMTSLKAAATDLVTALEAFENDALQMAVIPFSQHINVGLSRRNEVWLTDATDYTDTFPEVCTLESPVIGTTNCRLENTAARPAEPAVPPGTCYNDGVPYACGGTAARPAVPAGTREVCDNILGPEENVCTTRSPRDYVWNGCVGSRTAPWDGRVDYASRPIPVLMNTMCGTEIQPLTNNLPTISSTIASLNANGETYLPSGLLWGWRALTSSRPLTEASGEFTENRRSVMVLMTDGANTKSKLGNWHNGDDEVAANILTKRLCDDIKTAKIEVYTIAYEFGDIESKNILRDCASNLDMFFDAQNSADLERAFESIGESLLKLRLTQ